LALKVVKNLTKHPLKIMLDKGLFVTINSDDPAYFGGYLNENYIEIQKALNLSKEDIIQLAGNSFKASFLNEIEKSKMLQKLKNFINSH
jgi:adenosine deaminase